MLGGIDFHYRLQNNKGRCPQGQSQAQQKNGGIISHFEAGIIFSQRCGCTSRLLLGHQETVGPLPMFELRNV